MRAEGRRRRRGDPVKGAKVLLAVPDGALLDRLSQSLRDAGMRVVALNRLDALVPLTRAFRPDLALLGADADPKESARAGRRVWRRFRGAVPVVYLGEVADPDGRTFLFEEGRGLGIVSPRAPASEWVAFVRRTLAFRDGVVQAERAAHELRSPSMHDDATGLYNRRFLLELVGCELRRRERHGGSFCVLIGELDDFARFRRTHGEDACERLMAGCASLLRGSLREADVLARVGRYHFGALLPGMTAEALPELLGRLERRLGAGHLRVDGGEGGTVTAAMTFGHASFPDVVGPAQRIFAQAIQSLDRAREDGRAAAGHSIRDF